MLLASEAETRGDVDNDDDKAGGEEEEEDEDDDDDDKATVEADGLCFVMDALASCSASASDSRISRMLNTWPPAPPAAAAPLPLPFIFLFVVGF